MVVISEERRNKKNHLERVGEKMNQGKAPGLLGSSELHLSLTVMTLKRPHAARWCNFLQHRSDVCGGAAGST